MAEEKYTPDYVKMTLAEQQGAAKASKNMADRRFQRFEGDVQEVIERGRYDKDDYQIVKDLKKDAEQNIDSYEDIVTHLDGVYAANPSKVAAEIEELAENFELIAERREKLRRTVKEANAAIEDERNKYEVKKSKDDKDESSGSEKRGGNESKTDKQFKQPAGAQPDKISSEFTPLMAQNWAAYMRLYIKTCSNLEVLSAQEQRTLCKKFVNPTLWSQIEFFRTDNMEVMVKRVEEAFNTGLPPEILDLPHSQKCIFTPFLGTKMHFYPLFWQFSRDECIFTYF